MIGYGTGQKFVVDRLSADDLKVGLLDSSWYPSVEHSGIPDGQAKAIVAQLVAGMLLGTSAGALNVTDEWNRLLPDYKFTQASDFLAEAWNRRP